jgi:ABC-type xylose transport system permease subunit
LQIAVLVIVALGMTLVILTEGIDLSLGPVLGLCGVVMGMMVVTDWPLWMALGAAVLIGAGLRRRQRHAGRLRRPAPFIGHARHLRYRSVAGTMLTEAIP